MLVRAPPNLAIPNLKVVEVLTSTLISRRPARHNPASRRTARPPARHRPARHSMAKRLTSQPVCLPLTNHFQFSHLKDNPWQSNLGKDRPRKSSLQKNGPRQNDHWQLDHLMTGRPKSNL